MEYAIVTKNLTKVYKIGKEQEIRALDNVSIKIRRGEFFGLLGPNGAGKTTLTKILATLLIQDAGEAWVNGYNVLTDPDKVRKSIGWMQGETGGRALYWRLSGIDNLRFFAALQGVSSKVAEKRIWAFLKFLDLDKDAFRLVKDYSTGMKMKIMLIRALLHNPDILILDEPTVGLDVESTLKIREFLKTISRELDKTILFTSHNMYEVEQLCDRIAIINKGRIMFIGSPIEIKEKVESLHIVQIQLRSDKVTLEEMIRDIERSPYVTKILNYYETGNVYNVRVQVEDPYLAISDIANILRGRKIEKIERVLPTLEEAFVKLLGS